MPGGQISGIRSISKQDAALSSHRFECGNTGVQISIISHDGEQDPPSSGETMRQAVAPLLV